MAEILPFRGWRYNPELASQIEELTSPLFDVVSAKQRAALYQNPLNSIHVSVPQSPFAADRAALLLQEWKQKRVIVQDRLPAIYVYYQYFRLPGESRELCRKGFLCNIRLHSWEERVIQRHENTIPSSVNDRIEMLEKTELQVSPTHGLYTDPSFELEQLMDEAIGNKLLETEDYQGVRDVFGVIHDAAAISKFMACLKGKNIILADGHHRYEASLEHQRKQKRANPNHSGNEGYNFHFMYLTNSEAGDLRILPTHRVIANLPNFERAKVMEILERYFIIKTIEEPYSLPEILSGKWWAFGLVFSDATYKIRLKENMINQIPWPFPEVIKNLDLTVLHYFVIEKALGIPGRDQRTSGNISFDRNFTSCVEQVHSGKAQLVVVTNEVAVEDVKRVCDSGYTMPQKSTYFYPKIVTGFVFSSILESEFKSSPFSAF